MGDHERKQEPDYLPDFEIVLWGYHRKQVDRCLVDLTARLEQALCQLDSVEVLQAQLCDAQLAVDQLRRTVEERPSVANRISMIMKAAEELHARARRQAEARSSGTGGRPAVASAE